MTWCRYLVWIGQFLFRFRSFLPLAMLLGLTCLLWETIPSAPGRGSRKSRDRIWFLC